MFRPMTSSYTVLFLSGMRTLCDKHLSTYRLHGSNNWYHSDRAKTPEFRDVLDKYLNTKLIENGKQPVISFYELDVCLVRIRSQAAMD